MFPIQEKAKMATISELFKQGVKKMRLPHWDEYTYLELILSPLDERYYCPLAILHHVATDGKEPPLRETRRLIIFDQDDRWETAE